MAAAEMLFFSGITLAVLPPQGRDRLIAVAAAAKAGGTTVAVDPNFRARLWPAPEAREWIARAYGAASVALTVAEEEATLFPGAGEGPPWPHLDAAGCREVAAKRGADGVVIAAGGAVCEVAAATAGAVIDTTGAGDSFNAAYLAARLQGLAPEAAAARGCALGARVVGHRGAIIPRAAMQDLIEEYGDARSQAFP